MNLLILINDHIKDCHQSLRISLLLNDSNFSVPNFGTLFFMGYVFFPERVKLPRYLIVHPTIKRSSNTIHN